MLGLVFTMLVTGMASAQQAQTRFVYANRIVAPGTNIVFTVSCPPGWIEVGAVILSNPSAMPVLASRATANTRRRIFAFDNRANSQPAYVRVRITCLRIPPPGKRRSTGKRRWIRVGKLYIVKSRFKPIKLRRAVRTPRCPKRHHLVGPGMEFRPADDGSAKQQAAWASVRETGDPVEIIKAWINRAKQREQAEYLVEERGFEPLEMRVSARCVGPAAISGPIGPRGPRPPTHRYPIRIKLPRISGEIPPGINRATAKCPKGSISIGTGHAFPPDVGLSLFRSFPLSGRGAFWEIDSPAATEVLIKVQPQCLDTSHGWRHSD